MNEPAAAPRAPAADDGAPAAGLPGDRGRPDDQLRSVVEELLSRRAGDRTTVVRLERRPSEFATLYPAELVSAVLASGTTIELFVKRLGAEQADHPDKQRRDREVAVYEELLAGRDLPVPSYYGHSWDGESRRLELFLERVDGWDLRYHGIERWIEAARSLGRLHAFFARRPGELARADFLLRLDAGYFEAWARRAVASTRRRSRSLGGRLDRLVAAYDAAALLAAQPPTLVHNDLAPKNVLGDRSSPETRVCFVDWELAARGCALLDLVHLAHGLAAADERRLVGAYGEGAAGSGLLPTSEAALERLLAACRLHKTLYRLAHADVIGVEDGVVERWVDEAWAFSRRV